MPIHTLLRARGHCMSMGVSHSPVVRDAGAWCGAGLKTHSRPHAVVGVHRLNHGQRDVHTYAAIIKPHRL